MNVARAIFLLPMAAASLSGCHLDMYEQPKYLPEKPNYYFPREEVDRLPVPHTVPRGPVEDGSPFYTGMNGSTLAAAFPYPITEEIVEHGREVFEINCSECHGRDGHGNGIIVQRGFPAPPSFHSDRLRTAPVGHFFNVITNGYGIMYPFGSRIGPADRWAVVSYIRALQFSQNVPASALSDEDRAALEKAK